MTRNSLQMLQDLPILCAFNQDLRATKQSQLNVTRQFTIYIIHLIHFEIFLRKFVDQNVNALITCSTHYFILCQCLFKQHIHFLKFFSSKPALSENISLAEKCSKLESSSVEPLGHQSILATLAICI